MGIRHRRLVLLPALVLGVVAPLFAMAPPAEARLTTSTKKCSSLVVIGARGSGQSVGSGSIPGFGPQGTAAIKNAVGRIQRTGSLRYQGLTSTQYPAVGVNWTTAFNRDPYWASVKKGAYATMAIAKDLASSCSSTKIALVGYSQGASVMRWAIRDLPDRVKDRVVLIGLIGDPERRGFNQTAPEIGRHVFFTGDTLYGSGALGAGPALPSRRRSAIVTACHVKDDICNRTGAWSTTEHGSFYQSSTGASKIGSAFYGALLNNGFK